jgi:Uncharacterised nucleotidyltransferase
MAASFQSERMSSPAAATAIAYLLSCEFDAAGHQPQEITPELAREIIQIGRANKILKPLLKRLDKLGVPIPDDAAPEIAAYSRKAMKNNAAALATLREVAKTLSDAGIIHAAFKGPVRQIALGQDVFERPVADVDVLVRRRDFGRATDVLKNSGYWIPLFCDSPWWRYYLGEHPLIPNARNRLGVDLHHRTQHPSCPRPHDQEALLDDLEWTEIGGAMVPIFGPVSIFLNTVMSIVKGLANREATGGHVLDLARQLTAADEQRLAEFKRAARDQKLSKSYTVAKRAVFVMTGVAPEPVPSWFVPDDALLAMLLTPEDPAIRWPRHTKLLWKLVDGDNRLGRAVKFTREFAWWTAAEFTRRTHDVSQMPARAEPEIAAAAAV